MSKAEKRTFRLFVNRDHRGEDKLFVQLFDVLDRAKSYREEDILAKVDGLKKSQLSNIKAHLSRQILSSLKHLYADNSPDIQVRELIDFARVLLDKGIIKASLDTLEKAKKLAQTYNNTNLLFLILEEEKRIEMLYITGNSTQKAFMLNDQSIVMLNSVNMHSRLSNLSLMLYGIYLKQGYVKDEDTYKDLKTFFDANLPKVDIDKLGFYEKVFYYQSHVWFAHMCLDFVNYFKYSQKWVDCFEEQIQMKDADPVMYFKGLHNTLNALYIATKRDKFLEYYKKYASYGEMFGLSLSANQHSNYILFKFIHQLNAIFLTGDYSQGARSLTELTQTLNANPYDWDANRLMTFHYKVACVYFGNENYDETLYHLSKINEMPYTELRQDIQCFSRILTLITHFELGNDYLLPYQLKSVYRFLSKMKDLQFVQREMLGFIRRMPQTERKNLHIEFQNLHSSLSKIEHDTYQMRPFLYLDVISWLESKIANKPIQEVIRAKIESRNQ
jgi:hypothetical protein